MPRLDPTYSAPVDLAALNEVTGGDPEFTADLVESYIASSHGLLTKARDFFARGDRYQLARAVHQLAGASSNLCAEPLHELCSDLERAADTATETQLEQQIACLAAELARVTAVLTNMGNRASSQAST